MHRAVIIALIAVVPGCVAAGFTDFPPADGGPNDGGGDCDGGLDGGCTPGNESASDACASLVENCCGASCGHSAGCEAATLLQQFEPDQCTAALSDTQRFPVCEAGNCDTLVSKVCGDDDRCDSAPGCAPAKQLQTRANDPASTQAQVDDADASCLQALEDEVVFAPCP
jgi:hypothetical protein